MPGAWLGVLLFSVDVQVNANVSANGNVNPGPRRAEAGGWRLEARQHPRFPKQHERRFPPFVSTRTLDGHSVQQTQSLSVRLCHLRLLPSRYYCLVPWFTRVAMVF